jgi:diguanylate cyclase (GGDEF)-like protein
MKLAQLTAPVAAFLLAMATTLCCVQFIYTEQQNDHLVEFKHIAENQTVMLNTMINNDLGNIGASANFYQSSTVENYSRFPIFAQTLIENSNSLIALEWMPKVAKADIDSHIQKVRQQFPDFEVYTIPRGIPKIKGYIFQDNRPAYIISDIYPRTESSIQALGFYSSRRRFELVLEDVVLSRQPNVSDPVRLIRDGLTADIAKEGLLVYTPVFEPDQTSLKGIIVGVIRMTRYFDDLVLKTASDQRLLLKIVDTGFGSEDVSVMFENPEWQQTEGATLLKKIELQNRTWNVEFKLEHVITDVERTVLISIFIAGCVISLLLSLVVYIMQNQQRRLAIQLYKRTKELQFMAEHDSLTALYNRHAFNQFLTSRIKQQQTFTLIVLDVDNFKCINDGYGHPAGDAVLKHLATCITKNSAPQDAAFRVGGDEFFILPSIVEYQNLNEYLSALQTLIKVQPCIFEDDEISYTLSIGVNVWNGQPEEAFLQCADNALYQSKKNGRDHITVCA